MVAIILAACLSVILSAAMVGATLLTGTVRDSSGAPLADVAVRAIGWRSSSYQAFTEGDGSYALVVARDVYRISVEAHEGSELATWVRNRIRVRANTVIDVVLHPGVVLTGRILDADGNPVAAAGVSAADSFFPIGTARTDVLGWYRLRLLPGTYRIGFGGPPLSGDIQSGCLRGREEVVEVRQDTTIDFTLLRGALLTAHLSADGRAAPRASLWAYTLFSAFPVNRRPDGSYRLCLGPGAYSLLARPPDPGAGVLAHPGAPGLAEAERSAQQCACSRLSLIKVDRDTTVHVSLERGVSLSGRVAGPGDERLVGVTLSAFVSQADRDTGLPLGAYRVGTACTDAQGLYEMRVLPGTYDLLMDVPPQYGLASWQWLREVAVSTDRVLNTVLERGHVLRGRITDAVGAAALLVDVLALPPQADTQAPSAQARGDVDGAYRLRLRDGVYDLLALARTDLKSYSCIGRRFAQVEMRGDRSLDLEIPALESTVLLSGAIRAKDGCGRAAVIHACDATTGDYAATRVAPHGAYRLRLPCGTYDLTIQRFGLSGPQRPELKGLRIAGDAVCDLEIDGDQITVATMR